MERKILVAIGNTGLDKTTISYLASLFKKRTDVSFHLFNFVPLHDMTESQQLWSDWEEVAATRPDSLKKRSASLAHLLHLQNKLRGAGFQENQIQAESLFSYGSVAFSLLHHAQTGAYDAIILGKRDLSLLEKMISGSISSELWRMEHSVPLWLINGNPQTRNFLVPVDCSLHSMRAVGHLGFILQGTPDVQITLFHSASLLAAEEIAPREAFYEQWGKEWCDKHLKGDANGHYHFHAAEQILKENGIPAANLDWLRLSAGIEPAQVIVREIEKGSYGTIVMGRRLDREKNIFKGVSDRVLANVHDVALWGVV